MATESDPDQDKLNPGARHHERLTGGDHKPGSMGDFDRSGIKSESELSKSRNGFYEPGDSAQDSKKKAGDAEKKSIEDTAAGKSAIMAAQAFGASGAATALKLVGKLKVGKTSGITASIIAIIVVGFVGISSLMTALGPIAFVTNVIDDFNDQLAFIDLNDQKLLRTKLTSVDNDFVKGCETRLSIRCKLKTLSTKEVQRMRDNGIVVNEKRRIGNRVFIDSYEVDGELFDTAKKLKAGFKNNQNLRLAFKSARSMKFFGLNDRVSRWFDKAAGVSRAKPVLEGETAQEKAAALAKGESKGSLKGTPVEIPDDEEGRYRDEHGNIYSKEQAENIIERQKNLSSIANVKAGSMLARSVSITGAADMVCSVKRMIGMGGKLSEALKNWKLMEYAAPVAASVGAIMAGHGNMTDGEVVGEFFMALDGREQVEDVEATLKKSVESSDENTSLEDLELAETIYKANPDFGSNATDSPSYQVIAHGVNYSPTLASEPYSLNSSVTNWGAMFGLTANFIDTLPGASESDCDFIQSWYMRGLGFLVGVGLLFVPIVGQSISAGNIVKNLAVFVAVFVAMVILGEMISNLADGSAVPADIDQKPVDRGSAMVSGLSLFGAYAAQGRGMEASSEEDFMTYRDESIASNNDYRILAMRNSSPFDTKNPYSAVSQVASALNPHRIKSYDLPSFIASTSSLLSSSSTSMLSHSAMAVDNQYASRFDHCRPNSESDEVASWGIDRDFLCNYRYSVSGEVMGIEVDEALDYMIGNGYVNEDSGLPEGYNFPDPEASSNFAIDLLLGIVNEFYATRNYAVMGDYAKFLDYCAYRTMPLGNTYEESSGFGAAGREWISGEKCVEDSEMMNNFRAYTGIFSGADITEVPVETVADAGGSLAPPPGAPENTVPVGEGWAFKNGEDYSQYACAEGTNDNGVYTNQGNNTTIRLCGIGSQNVASVISQNTIDLLNLAKSQGINMTIQSGHRTFEFQQDLWYGRGCDYQACNVAKPGTSIHESGLALDLGLSGASFCFPPDGISRVPTCPGNIGYEFMVKNGRTYGFFKLPSEAWHWQTMDQ